MLTPIQVNAFAKACIVQYDRQMVENIEDALAYYNLTGDRYILVQAKIIELRSDIPWA